MYRISTLLALIIVASLQAILVTQFLDGRHQAVRMIAIVVLVTLHALSLVFVDRLRTGPTPGWRIVTASGVFLLAPQAAIRQMEHACTFPPEGCGWIWWLATAIAICAMLGRTFFFSILTALAACGTTLMLAAVLLVALSR
jgi:hypothetical protein